MSLMSVTDDEEIEYCNLFRQNVSRTLDEGCTLIRDYSQTCLPISNIFKFLKIQYLKIQYTGSPWKVGTT